MLFGGLNWTFFGLRSGPLDFFWVRVKPEGLFLGLTISPHSHIPVTNIPEYPPPPPGLVPLSSHTNLSASRVPNLPAPYRDREKNRLLAV